MTTTPTPTPTAVVFDLGKVLLEFDYGIVARRLAAHSGRDAEKIRGLLDQSPLLFRFESGQMTNDEFFREVSSLLTTPDRSRSSRTSSATSSSPSRR